MKVFTIRCILAAALLFGVPGASGLHAGTLEDRFAEANRYYDAQDFEKAREIYEQLVRDYRIASADLYYNLGNACMKTNRLGYAVLYYQKAKKLRENDPDVTANLSYAESLRVDKIEKPEPSFYARAFRAVEKRISINQGALLALLFYFLLGLLLFLRLIGRPLFPRVFSRYAIGAAVFLVLLFTLITAVKYHRVQYVREGVLLAPAFEARSGPGRDNTALFNIHEGLTFRIRSERGDWYQVSLENGLTGWVEKKAVGVI
jgi:tetratricopeptide (TPR) repeat protein